MPTTAKKTLENSEKIKTRKFQQQATCKVSHGLTRKTSLIVVGQRIKSRKYKQRDAKKTVWLNDKGKSIAVQIKHIDTLGIDMNNFFTPKAYEHEVPKALTDANTSNAVVDKLIPLQSEPTLKKCHLNRKSRTELMMNTCIVQPIEKSDITKIKNSPKITKASAKYRVQKPNCGKRALKASRGKTNRKSYERRHIEYPEYDDLTLIDFDAIILKPSYDSVQGGSNETSYENLGERTTLESSQNEEQACCSQNMNTETIHSEDGLSPDNNIPIILENYAYLEEKDSVHINHFLTAGRFDKENAEPIRLKDSTGLENAERSFKLSPSCPSPEKELERTKHFPVEENVQQPENINKEIAPVIGYQIEAPHPRVAIVQPRPSTSSRPKCR
ncbi:uncharacterized protein LOC128263039 isoform X2 [Drosophila gunungcola]|nr:uncharacterized protein LOC128263039 isoform X2 [Drosophila gunungcola]